MVAKVDRYREDVVDIYSNIGLKLLLDKHRKAIISRGRVGFGRA